MICHKLFLLGYYEQLFYYYGLGDVFVVYCKDKGSQNLSSDNLYNPRLQSVERHPVLSKLKERMRVISVDTKFHPHQVSHLESCCNKIYQWCACFFSLLTFHQHINFNFTLRFHKILYCHIVRIYIVMLDTPFLMLRNVMCTNICYSLILSLFYDFTCIWLKYEYLQIDFLQS